MKIQEEIENVASSLAKSSAESNFDIEMLKSTIKDLGISGLKAVIPTLNDSQKVLLKSVLTDMKVVKASNSLDIDRQSKDINPPRKEVVYTEEDEKMAAEAKKKNLDTVRHQGDDSVQSGEVIKAEMGGYSAEPLAMSKDDKSKPASGKPDTEADKAKSKVPEVQKAEGSMDMSEKMDDKKSDKKPKENKEHMHLMEKAEEKLEKPPVSQAQRAAMHAAAAGHSTLGIPKKVGKEFAEKDPGGKLPEHTKKSDGDADYSVDGDRIMQNPTNGSKRESKAPQSTDEKKENEKEPIMSIEDKKAAAKENLHKMVKRMQVRGMEKGKCVAALAKSLGVDEAKIEPLWEMIKKCECEKCATPEKDQVKPAPIMTEEKKPAKREPMSGHAHETADEGEQAPAVKKSTVETVDEVGKEGKKGGKVIGHRKEGGMPVYASERETKEEKGEETSNEKDVKKSDSFFYEDEIFYTAKNTANPFNNRTHGQNVAYTVDAFIEEASQAQVSALAKSNFLYHSQGHAKPAKSIDELIEQGMDHDTLWEDIDTTTIQKSGTMLVKSFSDSDFDSEIDAVDMWGEPVKKSAEGKAAVAEQVKENAKAQAEAKKEEKQEIRDAKIGERLTRIEERAGHKMVTPKDV